MTNPHPEPICQLALTQIPSIGVVLAKALVDAFGHAGAIFSASKKQLCDVNGISVTKADAIRQFDGWKACTDEYEQLQKRGIRTLFLTDADYPKRLLNCYDPPTLLFYEGQADLNASKILGVVGTRSATAYGRTFLEQCMQELAAHEVLIVSGLAYGVDTLAHREALQQGLPTVAVVAHGLHTIYPPENRKMAAQMVAQNGGILTELWLGEQPDKHNFPTRNRIVAGMVDALLVVETGVEGGSMITAGLAHGYNRDIFALPGRINDAKSKGCLQLIRDNRATLVTGAGDILEAMNWLPRKQAAKPMQRQLFMDLTPEERTLAILIGAKEKIHVDELRNQAGMTPSALATTLLNLELKGLVTNLPGNMYATS